MSKIDNADKNQIIIKRFEDSEVDFINRDDEVWLTAETIGINLEYNDPRTAIMRLYHRNKDEIEEYTSIVKLTTEAGMRETTIFSEMGIYLLILFSKQPKAKDFRKWVVNIVKEIRKTGQYIEDKNVHPLVVLKKQMEALGQVLDYQIKQQQELESVKTQVQTVDIKLLDFKRQYEDEKLITPQTMKTLRDMVQECVKTSGDNWSHFYKLIRDKFQISGLKGITEKLGRVIIKWMKLDPKFLIYLNQDLEEDF